MKQNMKIVNILGVLLGIAEIALTVTLIVLLTKYAVVSTQIVLYISIIFASVIILSIVFSIYGYLYKKKAYFRILGIVLATVLCAVAAYGVYYVKNVNDSINKIIVDPNGTEKETVGVAFVTYDNTKITSLKDLDKSVNFGYIDNEAFQEGNVLALKELEDNSITVNLVPYNTYGDMILALFDKEVDVAAFPDGYYDMFIVNDGYEEYLQKTKVIHEFSKEVEVSGLGEVDKKITAEPFTVLFIGKDEVHSDVLILATFNPQRLTITLTSIARDSFVPIACYKNNQPDKITHSRVISRECTINTVENLLGIDVDFFIETSFQGVVDIVDAIGGLWLTSPVEFVGQTASYNRGEQTVWVDQGYQLMNGAQVLAFARERHQMPDGDFSRQENQQQIIVALAKKLLEMRSATQALSVIEAAGSNISTNFTLAQMTELLNFGLDIFNNTYAGRSSSTNVFEIYHSRIVGYGSQSYNESLELPLWIYKLYDGSIKDNLAVIRRNLGLDTTLKSYESANFDIAFPYFSWFELPSTYDEPKVHEKMPDIMPAMYSSKDIWTYERAKEWAAGRGITVNVIEVKEGDSSYSSAYAHNRIIAQEPKYGVKTSKISSISIWVIKHNLDCGIEANRVYDECSESKIVPNFVGMTRSQLNNWMSNHSSVTVNIVTIEEGQAGYDTAYVNKVVKQDQQMYSKLSDHGNNLTVYLCGYPTTTLDLGTIFSKISQEEVTSWFNNNWYVAPTFSSEFSETVTSGHVISVSAGGNTYTSGANNPSLKGNTAVSVVISKGKSITIPTFSTKAEYEQWIGNHVADGFSLNITEETLTEDPNNLNGSVKSQSIQGTYPLNQETANSLSITVYKFGA